MTLANPNFPSNLDIHPSKPHGIQNLSEFGDVFDSLAQQEAIRQYGIAGRVWEAAYLITSYVQPTLHYQFDPSFIPSTTLSETPDLLIIELGSGSGLVASAFTKTFTPKNSKNCFIATDLPEVCPLLETNLGISSGNQSSQNISDYSTTFIRPLAWGNKQHSDSIFSELTSHIPNRRLTHIICSDLVYFPELLAPLLRSLLHLTSHPFVTSRETPHSTPIIYISYKVRSLAKEATFWAAFGLWFEFCPVLFRENMEGSTWERFGSHLEDTSFLFYASRRLESLQWVVPDSDNDLLDGVGAEGTNTRKSDDTFENLLLMSL